MILQAQMMCYEPVGVSFEALSCSAHGYDSLIDGKKVLHRCGCLVPYRGMAGIIMSLHRNIAGTDTYYDVDNVEIADFYAVLLHEDRILRRMMFFPRSVLSELIGPKKTSSFHVYPSNTKPCKVNSRLKQERQLPYEINLSEPLSAGPDRDKFLQILNEGQILSS